MEEGRFLSAQEISIKVQLYGAEENKIGHQSMLFYFKDEYNVGQCKNEICEAFELYGDDFSNFLLYRLDNFGEPAFPIRKEKNTFSKNNV